MSSQVDLFSLPKEDQSNLVIGFATEFYTLWSFTEEVQYVTDAYGNHHAVGKKTKFYYIKNISTELDKVKKLYPSLRIDDDLRGQVKYFERFSASDFPAEYFWKGKYRGYKVDEIIEQDFNYCLWYCENINDDISEQIKNSEKYISHIAENKKQHDDAIKSAGRLNAGDEIELEFISNGFNLDETTGLCWAKARHGELDVYVQVPCKPVGGMYPYLMPIINGKAQRTKNKTIKVTVTVADEPVIKYKNQVTQSIEVA